MTIKEYTKLLSSNKAVKNIKECESIDEWRKIVPMDYFGSMCFLFEVPRGKARDEMFKIIYETARCHTPETLYKYFSLTDNKEMNDKKFKTVVDKKIYMSSINDFNDPFDGKGFYYDNNIISKYSELDKYEGRIFEFSDLIKCTCFTGNGVQSMPMWSHYSNNHQGFCVEYDIKENSDLDGLFSLFNTQMKGLI